MNGVLADDLHEISSLIKLLKVAPNLEMSSAVDFS